MPLAPRRPPTTSATRRRRPLAEEYGDTPPWHDIQAAISGPAVHDVETDFRERWEDPTPLSRSPVYWLAGPAARHRPAPRPAARRRQPPPPPVEGGTHVVQLLRTYPNLRHGRDYPFARGGERSVARGYTKAVEAGAAADLRRGPVPLGQPRSATSSPRRWSRTPDLHVIARACRCTPTSRACSPHAAAARPAAAPCRDLMEAAPGPGRGLRASRTTQGTPVYVHAKACVVDDTWATIGSDNFNRRSWTHDSELTAAVVDRADGDRSPYARPLRLRAGRRAPRPPRRAGGRRRGDLARR